MPRAIPTPMSWRPSSAMWLAALAARADGDSSLGDVLEDIAGLLAHAAAAGLGVDRGD